MCKYCERFKIDANTGWGDGPAFKVNAEVLWDSYTWLAIKDGGEVYLHDADGNEIRINVCPMCGRKLNAQEELPGRVCDGCEFLPAKATSKRCLTCSRNYGDKHREPRKREPLTHTQEAALARILSFGAVLTAGSTYTEQHMGRGKRSERNR